MHGTLADWAQASSAECADVVALLEPAGGVAQIARARERFEAGVVSCAAELAIARSKAGDKWPTEIAGRIVGDREGIEMATSWHAANHKARRFAAAGFERVTDLCCGIGGDAMGLVAQGLQVLGIDHDEARAWMCAQNASLGPGSCETIACDVLDPRVPTDQPFHLDPARRTDGKRITRFEDLVPGPEVIQEIAESRTAGAIKLNPGIDAGSLPAGELEILSERGRLTQAVLWTGSLAEFDRRATVIDRDGHATSIAGEPSRSDETSPIERTIHAMDPSVERADLVPVLVETTGLRHVQPGLGLLTGDSDAAASSPFLTAFEVLAELPWNPRRVKKLLASLDAGVVEVKTRAGVVHPDEQQKRLRGSGDRLLTVFVYRFEDGVRAVVTSRVGAGAPS